MVINELHQVGKLRRLTGDEIVDRCAGDTSKLFKNASQLSDVLPVVLRVRDEQDDLPATLVSLALSQRPVVPIVASNGSTDRTVEIAQRMVGEENVIDIEKPGLMGAMQAGVNQAQDQYGAKSVLITDGDTLVPARWAGNMEKTLRRMDTGNGALVYGRAIWAHGPKPVVDAAVTAKEAWRITKATLTDQPPRPQGGNQGMRFDPEGRMREALNSLNPRMFFREDFETRQVMTDAGVAVVAPMNPGIIILGRGGRDESLHDVFRRRENRKARHRASYQREYGKNI